MSIFKRKQNIEETSAPTLEQPEIQEQPEEEWIWVEGYKGTDANMCCRDYQYELGKQYNIPDEEEVKICENGFHLCLSMKDVQSYYGIGNSNRFFKVKALVRKSNVDRYKETLLVEHGGLEYYIGFSPINKLVAKSIIFISELTQDEILTNTDVNGLSKKYKDIAIKVNIQAAIETYQINTLVKDGYSKAFAVYLVNNGLFDKAHAVGSQDDLSMDMKVLWILKN
jgi:hypothetical protein